MNPNLIVFYSILCPKAPMNLHKPSNILFQETPDSQCFAAVELAQQRIDMYKEDKMEANRVAPKPKKAKGSKDLRATSDVCHPP